MGKSVKRTVGDPFAYKPEYNNNFQPAAETIAATTEENPFAFKPEYNVGIKKKDGITESETGSPTLSPSASPSESGADSRTFLQSDINGSDFFEQLYQKTVDPLRQNTASSDEQTEAKKQLADQVLSNPGALKEYNGNRIAQLNTKIQDLERKKLDYGEYVSAGVGARPTFSINNKQGYKQLEQEINSTKEYIARLKNNIADIATDFVMKDVDVKNFNPREKGREIVKIADPELDQQFQLAQKNGNALPGIKESEMERIGINAAKNFVLKNPTLPNKTELLSLLDAYESDFDERNFELTGQRVREKLGAQLYKEGKSGFWGYSQTDLDEAAKTADLSPGEQKVFQSYVKPLEKKIIGTDVPGSGFFRSFQNAIEKSAVGTGKSIGDITGIRDESDVAQEFLNQEIETSRFRTPGEGPTPTAQLQFLQQKEKTGKLNEKEQSQKKELENYVNVRNGWSKFKDGVGDLTGQVAWMALVTKGVGGVGAALTESGAAGGLLGGLTRSAVGTALSNETTGLFINSYLNSYDNYKQQAIGIMPGEKQASAREAYAKTMAAVEGLSERIFVDTKILNAFTKGIAPTVRDISTRFITNEITQKVAKEELQGALMKYLKPFGKEFVKSEVQESTEEAVVDLADGMAQSIYGGQPFDLVKTGQQAVNTFLTTALYSPLVSGMAAHGAYRQNQSQNAFIKASLVNMGANPGEYLKAVEDLQLSGAITQPEANEKIKLIKSASKFLQEIPSTRQVPVKVGEGENAKTVQQAQSIDYPQTTNYLLHRLNEGIIQEKIDNTTDEVVISQLNKDLKRSQEIRKGIYDGMIGVTDNLQEVIDNPEKAEELGIANAEEMTASQLIGTPFESKKTDVPREKNAQQNETQQVANTESETEATKSKSTEGQTAEIAPKEITPEKQKEATDFANELKQEGVVPDVYQDMIKSEDATGFWKMVAQQAQNVDEKWQPLEGEKNKSEQATIDAFGETIVNYAKELYPITQNKQTNENKISQEKIIPEKGNEETGIQQEGQDGGQKDDEGNEILTKQGAEPVAEAPLKKKEEIIKLPIEERKKAVDDIIHGTKENTKRYAEEDRSPSTDITGKVKHGDAVKNTLEKLKDLQTDDGKLASELLEKSDETSLKAKIVVTPEADKERAYYDADTDTIHFEGGSHNNMETVLHEITHALTTKKLPNQLSGYKNKGIGYLNTIKNTVHALDKNIKRLINLYEEAVKKMGLEDLYFGENGIANDYEAYKVSKNENKVYGLLNLDEFISEAFTNPLFQDQLKAIESDGITLWDKFVNFVKELLGIKKSNLLSDVLSVGKNIISTPRKYGEHRTDKVFTDNIDIKGAIERMRNAGFSNEEIKKEFDERAIEYSDSDFSAKPRVRVVVGKESEPKEEKAEPDQPGSTIDDYKMTTTDKVGKFLSGDTWEDVFGENPEGNQNYLVQGLSDMLQDGRNMIAIAQKKWGGDVMLFAKPLFQFIQNMSNDEQLTNKKAVLLATLLGELQEAKLRSPERFDAINQIEKSVFAYYQNYMNVRGKEIVAGRLLRLYRDKYIGDIFADQILDKEQVKSKKKIQEAEQKKTIDDKTAEEPIIPLTESEKKKEDKAAKDKTKKAAKEQSKKKKLSADEAKGKAQEKLKDIEGRLGGDAQKGLLARIKEAINKLNCK